MRGNKLTEEQWRRIQPLLPPQGRRGRPRADDRKALHGILYVLRTGGRWEEDAARVRGVCHRAAEATAVAARTGLRADLAKHGAGLPLRGEVSGDGGAAGVRTRATGERDHVASDRPGEGAGDLGAPLPDAGGRQEGDRRVHRTLQRRLAHRAAQVPLPDRGASSTGGVKLAECPGNRGQDRRVDFTSSLASHTM